ncbi:hypothetical protein O3P69_007057 [Scylla paramamosain]|uniref:Uncharacterized protein n=1 Tax=Scylla paramamosain TaxID=85552 RepID=A0AAW0V421_SCYPA
MTFACQVSTLVRSGRVSGEVYVPCSCFLSFPEHYQALIPGVLRGPINPHEPRDPREAALRSHFLRPGLQDTSVLAGRVIIIIISSSTKMVELSECMLR